MTAPRPETIDEWRAYTESLDEEALHEAAKSANSVGFVRTLQQEGRGPEEIHAVMILFARRFQALGLRPPTGGLYDLFEMMAPGGLGPEVTAPKPD